MKDLLVKEYLRWLRILDEQSFVLEIEGKLEYSFDEWQDAKLYLKSLEDTITCLKDAILFTEVFWNM